MCKDWACEATLWTEWYTLGTLVAMTECRVISIHRVPFTMVIQEDYITKLCTQHRAPNKRFLHVFGFLFGAREVFHWISIGISSKSCTVYLEVWSSDLDQV